MSSVPKLVIIGGGFSGLWSALGAARKRELAGHPDQTVDIIVVAPEPTLYIRPRLYENDVSGAQAPLSDVFAAAGVRYIQGTVQDILVESKSIRYLSALGERHTLAYDRLVLASGSKLYRPESVTGLAEFSFDADDMPNARKLDAHLKSLAEIPDSPARNTVVVGGGGFTGTEIAAEMPRRLRGILGEDAKVRVVIIESGDRIDFMGEKSTHVVEEALASLGVEVLTSQRVASVDAEGMTTATGLRIASKTIIWTGGMRASSLTAQFASQRDGLGRLLVTQELKVPGFEDVFAAGDTASVAADDQGHMTLMSCQHAMNLGKTAGNNAMADLLDLPQVSYSQPVYGCCLALGPSALFTMGWEREVHSVGEEGYKIKTQINTQLIYPPPPDRAKIFAAADPAVQVIA
ncbi:hypothetical protein C8F01DRAFT_1045308 [Mycena amicta]|nr:hypothetical protein C8F01DRAFT_1045308 [Mycena amicta]